jgi:hypothetical protein
MGQAPPPAATSGRGAIQRGMKKEKRK